MQGFFEFSLEHLNYGNIKVILIIGEEGSMWGKFKFLENTDWNNIFKRVPREIYDRAIRKDLKPILEILKDPPINKPYLIPKVPCINLINKSCVLSSKECISGSKKVPDCFYTSEKNLTEFESEVINYLVRFLRDEYYFIVLT